MYLLNYKKNILKLFILQISIILLLVNSSAYAAQINTPIIKKFAPQSGESNALRLELEGNNKGTNYSLEVINISQGKTNNLSGSSKYYVYQNLESDKEYSVIVRACLSDSYSCSAWTNKVSATTTGNNSKEKLSTPTITSINSLDKNRIRINYSIKEKVTGVEIYNNNTGKTSKTTNNKYYILSGLRSGTKYSIKIRTYKSINNNIIYSNYTNSKIANTKKISLKTPTIKSLTASDKSIKIKYSTKGTITGVQINNITTGKIKTVKSKNNYTWKSLKSGTKYKFSIRSYYKKDGNTYYSSWSKTKTKKTDSILKKVKKLKKYSSYKVLKSYSKNNMKKVTLIKSSHSENIPQAFCNDGSHYIVQFSRKNSDSYGRLISYTKKGKKVKTGPALSLGHANGVTCGKNISKIYSVNRGGTKSTIINKSSFKRSGTKTLPGGAYSIAYDDFTNQYYIEGGGTVRVLNKELKQVKSFKVKKNHPHTQDAGAYHGIFMQGYTDSKYGSNYIDLYRVKDGAYLGSYKVYIGELESIIVDNGYLVLLINIKDSPNAYIYKSKYKLPLP